MKSKVIFFGNERIASGCNTKLPILKSLTKSGYTISLIVISEAGTNSRNKKTLEVEEFAKDNEIELYQYRDAEKLLTKLRATEGEMGVLAAFGKIIPGSILNHFEHGIINLHPSLLPKYRGPTPIESAILNGDSFTGVSLMMLGSGMDDGDILEQSKVILSEIESKQEIADKLGKLGAQKLIEVLNKAGGSLPNSTAQTGEPTYCKKITASDGIIDPAKSATQLMREIKAFAGWPRSKFEFNTGKFIKITEAEIIDTKEMDKVEHKVNLGRLTLGKKRMFIEVGKKHSGKNLEIKRLQVPGKNEISAMDFLNGHRDKLIDQ